MPERTAFRLVLVVVLEIPCQIEDENDDEDEPSQAFSEHALKLSPPDKYFPFPFYSATPFR